MADHNGERALRETARPSRGQGDREERWMQQVRAVSPIGDGDANNVPVRDLGPAIRLCTQVLGFSLVTNDQRSAGLERDAWRRSVTLGSRTDV